MFTLKSKSIKRLSAQEIAENRLPAGRVLQLELSLVFTNGDVDIQVSTFISTKDEAKRAIKQNLDRLNDQEELKKEIEEDTFTIEEETPEPPVVDEKKKALQELNEAIAEAEFMEKAEEIANKNTKVKEKLDAFKAR